jgi:hypothetical protein
MKKLIIVLALLSISTPAIAQVNRTAGNSFSDLGTITARSNQEASRLCRKKGGNVVIKTGNRYTCHYFQRLAK